MTNLTPTQIDDIIAERNAARAELHRALDAQERMAAAFSAAIMALDGVTPYADSTGAMIPLDARIRTVVQRLHAADGELASADALLTQIRSALNVGPPSASDVGPDVPAEEVVRIVRARTIALLEEHAQIAAWASTPTGRLVLAADLCDRDPERARELLRLALPLIWASAKTLLLSRFRHHAK